MRSVRSLTLNFLRHIRYPNSEIEYVKKFCTCLNKIDTQDSSEFFYPFSPANKRPVPKGKTIICSNTVDFSIVLDSSLMELKKIIAKNPNRHYRRVETMLICGIEKFGKRINNWFLPDLLNRSPNSLKEAIQKILFYDALFWQANHWHVGLGRLDLILYKYYEEDIASGKITKEGAKILLLQMLDVLDKDIIAKSGMMSGDTGQYILIGGIDKNGLNVCNDLTFLFLDIFKNYQKPDPKLIVRVNSNTSYAFWLAASECAIAGSGSPLFINEDVVMKSMTEFGYKKDDVYNFGTSACWEPLVIGKSFDQNNSLSPLVPIKVLNALILECKKDYLNFSQFLDEFKAAIKLELDSLIHDINFDCSPLYSLFFQSCTLRGKDYSKGGADYNYHGIQVVGFSNTINALLNIKEFVFEEHILSMDDCKSLICTNFGSPSGMRKLFKSNNLAFGSTNMQVVELTNDLMAFLGDVVSKYTIGGSRVKIGFSSPNYIVSSKGVGASMDGRMAEDPFGVHISPITSGVDFFEVLDFASKLNYSHNRINGNVLDFPIPSAYIKHPDYLAYILKDACRKGAFEIQLSVLNHDKLVDAKRHPEKYPNLLVRVWGFSAFFCDLPEEYKDYIINRAKLYEES